MCEVTRNNFEEIYPSLEANIKRAAFVALDFEFSGLSMDNTGKSSLFDTGEDRYKKLRKSVKHFCTVQLGLSAFVPDQNNDSKYTAYSYNFYLFPSSFGPVDVRFMCQASTMEFLCQHKFDFNKFTYKGVSYLNEEQEMLLEQYLERSEHLKGLERKINETKLQDHCKEVASWSVKARKNDVLTLPGSNDLTDILTVIELKQRFRDIWVTEANGQIYIKKVTHQKRAQLETESFQEDEKTILKRMLGFTRVFRALSKYCKPIVGHNNFEDLMLMYEKFYKPLPEKYSAYKSDLCKMFPLVFDTKHMAYYIRKHLKNKKLLEETTLSELFQSLSREKAAFTVLSPPLVTHGKDFEKYAKDNYPHEAGFDAYMCGYVFLKMAHLFATSNKQPSQTEALSFHDYLVAVQPCANCVNIIRGAVKHVKLDDSDPKSEQLLLFVKSRSSKKKLSPKELAQTFSQFGSVDVQPIDSWRACVSVSSHRSFRDILKEFHRHPTLLVVRYKLWRHSPVIRALMWCGVAFFGTLSVWILYSGIRINGAD